MVALLPAASAHSFAKLAIVFGVQGADSFGGHMLRRGRTTEVQTENFLTPIQN